jgi:hypothetical protein
MAETGQVEGEGDELAELLADGGDQAGRPRPEDTLHQDFCGQHRAKTQACPSGKINTSLTRTKRHHLIRDSTTAAMAVQALTCIHAGDGAG